VTAKHFKIWNIKRISNDNKGIPLIIMPDIYRLVSNWKIRILNKYVNNITNGTHNHTVTTNNMQIWERTMIIIG
jgi:hypothetical protein